MKSGLRLLQRHGLHACKQLDPRKLQISKAKFHCSVTEKCQGICSFISTVCDFAVICIDMASPKRGYREAVKTPEGLELDLSAYGLHELPESLGIETTTGDSHTTSAPQTSETLEGKFTLDTPTTAHFQPASPSDLKVPTGNRSYRKSKRFLPLCLAVIIIGVVILALAIPLALQLKKPSKQ